MPKTYILPKWRNFAKSGRPDGDSMCQVREVKKQSHYSLRAFQMPELPPGNNTVNMFWYGSWS